MKQYITPEIKDVNLTVADIIQTSGEVIPTLETTINGKKATNLGSVDADWL